MPSNDNNATDFVAYAYKPSLPLATAFAAAFVLSTSLHGIQIFRTKTLYLLPLIIGGVFESIGYIGRIVSATETYPDFSLAPYIDQAILILIAPALLSASLYMILGRIVRASGGEQHLLIQADLTTKIFVVGDIMSFMIQSTGAGLLTKKDADGPRAGRWIIIGGLAIQIIFFGLFMVVVGLFYRRQRKAGRRDGVRIAPATQEKRVPRRSSWHLHLWMLFSASCLVMVRSVFRVIEYVQGDKGYLLSHELYLYIFDAALMILVLLGLNLVHPGNISAKISVRTGEEDNVVCEIEGGYN